MKKKKKFALIIKIGNSINSLAKFFKLQKSTIRIILENNNIKVLNAQESKHRQHEIKNKTIVVSYKNYFDKLDSLKSYVLGLIYGDGCVYYNLSQYKYCVTLVSNDMDILESTKELFGKDFKIKKRKDSNAFYLNINSKQLCEELISKFDLQSPKSNRISFPSLPEEMYSYFISGLLSTDGCILSHKNRKNVLSGLEFSYSSNSKSFIISLQNYLINKLELTKTKIKENVNGRVNTNYSVRYSGSQAVKILNFIYNDTNDLTRCKRKYEIFQNHLTRASNSII